MLAIIENNPLIVGFLILALATLILLGVVFYLFFKMRKFLVSVDSKNITDSLSFVSKNLSELHEFRSDMEKYLETVERRLRKSVQSVHTVRFNPFKGTGAGGNQSFATAFLNEHGDGVVISSLYSRDHVSVFSKPVKKHASEYEFSSEEKEALGGAQENLKG